MTGTRGSLRQEAAGGDGFGKEIFDGENPARGFWSGRQGGGSFFRYCPDTITRRAEMSEGDIMEKNEIWLKWAVELQSIAQAGLFYGRDSFDRERYERVREIAAEMICYKGRFRRKK